MGVEGQLGTPEVTTHLGVELPLGMTSSLICDLGKLHLPGRCPRLRIVILVFHLYPEPDLDLNSAQVYIVKKIHPLSLHAVW